MNQKTSYEPIIGFEIHVELKTLSKMFCGCPADWFGKKPNIQTCPVCLGLPGALPAPNKRAIEWTVLLGLALNCKIPLESKFDRKHYFYPDLPKGYQISQYDEPFCLDGKMGIRNPNIEIQNKSEIQNSKSETKKEKVIRMRRVHLEEDTGKLIHAKVKGKNVSLVDFNRSGVPLVEIVTEPDIRSAEEAKIFLKKLQQIIRYLGISDCDMEKGSMRLEPNISLRAQRNSGKVISTASRIHVGSWTSQDDDLPNYKVEVKNINSFRFVEKAVKYEIERQAKLLDKGQTPKQETRGFNEDKNITVSQRSKEEAHDYRYFPEPDIPPVRWTKLQIKKLSDQIPELPDEKLERFIREYTLSNYNASLLVQKRKTADYFEEAVKVSIGTMPSGKSRSDPDPGRIANWIINKKVDISSVLPAELIQQIKKATAIVAMDTDELIKEIEKVIKKNQKAVEDFKKGKDAAIMFLLGQVMRKVKGKASAQEVRKLLKEKLVISH